MIGSSLNLFQPSESVKCCGYQTSLYNTAGKTIGKVERFAPQLMMITTTILKAWIHDHEETLSKSVDAIGQELKHIHIYLGALGDCQM